MSRKHAREDVDWGKLENNAWGVPMNSQKRFRSDKNSRALVESYSDSSSPRPNYVMDEFRTPARSDRMLIQRQRGRDMRDLFFSPPPGPTRFRANDDVRRMSEFSSPASVIQNASSLANAIQSLSGVQNSSGGGSVGAGGAGSGGGGGGGSNNASVRDYEENIAPHDPRVQLVPAPGSGVGFIGRSHSGRCGTGGYGVNEKIVSVYFNSNVTSSGSTSFKLLLNGIAEGSDFYNRVGRSILINRIRLRASVFFDSKSSAGAGNNTGWETGNAPAYRVLVVYDRQPNGAAILWSDVIKQYDNAGSTHALVFDGYNPDNLLRFDVLYDNLAEVAMPVYVNISDGIGGSAATISGVSSTVSNNVYDVNIEVDEVTRFLSTGATISDVSTGALWLLTLCNARPTAAHAAEPIAIHGSAAVHYNDT